MSPRNEKFHSMERLNFNTSQMEIGTFQRDRVEEGELAESAVRGVGAPGLDGLAEHGLLVGDTRTGRPGQLEAGAGPPGVPSLRSSQADSTIRGRAFGWVRSKACWWV
jgi:hypothetical protein